MASLSSNQLADERRLSLSDLSDSEDDLSVSQEFFSPDHPLLPVAVLRAII